MKRIVQVAFFSFLGVLMAMPLAAQAQGIREDAKVLGLYVETLRTEISEFTRFRDALAKLRTVTINQRESIAVETRQEIDMQLYFWGLNDEDRGRAQIYEAVRKGAQLALQQRTELEARGVANKKLVDEAKSAVDIQAGKLGEASRALVQLSETASTKDELTFLTCYFKAVRTRTAELKEEAKGLSQTETTATTAKPATKPADDAGC